MKTKKVESSTNNKRKTPVDGIAHDKHVRLTQEHRRILESDMGHQEPIPITEVQSFTFSELYEKGGYSKHSEISPGEKLLTKEEVKSLKTPVIKGVTLNIDDIFTKRRHETLSDVDEKISLKPPQDKRQHRHLLVDVPPIPKPTKNNTNPLQHMQILKQQHKADLMNCDLYNPIEDVFELNQSMLEKPFHFESFLKIMKETGDTSMRQISVVDSQTFRAVFPVDDFDIFFLCICFKLDTVSNTFVIPKQLQPSVFYRNESLLKGEDDEVASAVRIFLKNVSVDHVSRYYFHCPCDDI